MSAQVDDKVAGLAVFQEEVGDRLEFVEHKVRGVVFKVVTEQKSTLVLNEKTEAVLAKLSRIDRHKAMAALPTRAHDETHIHVYVGYDEKAHAQRVVVYTPEDEGVRWAKLEDVDKLKPGKLKESVQEALDELAAIEAARVQQAVEEAAAKAAAEKELADAQAAAEAQQAADEAERARVRDLEERVRTLEGKKTERTE